MDRASVHTPGMSDCNRAIPFMLRPSDEAMADPAVREALLSVLEGVPEKYRDEESIDALRRLERLREADERLRRTIAGEA